jgi:hypothetical protein
MMRAACGRWVLTWVSCAGVLAVPSRVVACGGGFSPGLPSVPAGMETSFVAGHRMAYAVSDERTVLWSKLEVQGAPSDFSWVLPVRPGAFLELSRDAWFQALDAVTATRVHSPELECAAPEPPVSCGCGSGGAVKDDAKGVDGGDGTVTILSSSTVGPYETITLGATDGDDLTSWLNDHGYSVPETIAPVISAYVNEGFDFIALRLQAGANRVTPIRVVTPGRDETLPLRLVAAGAGPSVPMTLYLIGEGRFRLRDLHATTLDLSQLSWNFATWSSNYRALRSEALAEGFGASFLTTFARPRAFDTPLTDRDGYPAYYHHGSAQYSTLASLYFGVSGVAPGRCELAPAAFADSRLVTDSGSGVSPATFACGEADDLSAALIGMHPSAVWLTRLELELPRSALDRDCVVSNVPAEEVSNQLVARRFTQVPDSCVLPVFESGVTGRSNLERTLWLALFGFALLSRWRRRGGA